MSILTPDVRLQLTKFFSEKMRREVRLVLRCEKGEKCDVLRDLLEELSEVNDYISSEVEHVEAGGEELLPHIVMKSELGELHFYGIPAYYEFNTLIKSIVYLGDKPEPVSDSLLGVLNKCELEEDEEINMKVFVTQACPYCSEMALSAYRLTLATEGRVNGVVIDIGEFQDRFANLEIEAVPTFYLSKGEKEVKGVGLLPDDHLALHFEELCKG